MRKRKMILASLTFVFIVFYNSSLLAQETYGWYQYRVPVTNNSLTNKWKLPPATSANGQLFFQGINSNAGSGFGIIEAYNVSSPTVWMYAASGRNAFTVAKMDYQSGGANSANIDSYLTPLLQVKEDGTLNSIGDIKTERSIFWGSAKLSYTYPYNEVRFGDNTGWFMSFVRNSDNKHLLDIKDNGYVGIGTTNPQSLLSVKGKISAQEVQVTLNGWSDFVFFDSYRLRPLSEVETFIQENKHLPDVPSAAVVEKEGVNLGEMDAILLRKIEELTLYMIEIKKENESLKREIEKLK